MSGHPGGQDAWLVSTQWLNEQRQVRDAVAFNLGFGYTDPAAEPRPPMYSDIQLVRTPPEGIKGMKYGSPVIYGAECDVLDITDSVDMTATETREQRTVGYMKTTDGTRVTEFILNASINPVPGYTVVPVVRGVGAELFVVGHEWELPVIVKTNFKEAKTFAQPVIATVHVLAAIGDVEDDSQGSQEYVVTDYILKAVVRGKGLALARGTPARVRTVGGVWMFSWADCSADAALKAAIDSAVPYPDRFEVEEE